MKMKCFHMYPIWQLIANYGNNDKNNPQSNWHFLKFLWFNFHMYFIKKLCWQVTCKIQHQPTDWLPDKTSIVLSPLPYITAPPSIFLYHTFNSPYKFNPLNVELNPICYLLALLGAHHFLHVSRIRVKSLTFKLLMSYICGAPILDVSRSHTTTQHSR